MIIQKGYKLESMIAKLRIRGMYEDADRLEDTQTTSTLSSEAQKVIRHEYKA